MLKLRNETEALFLVGLADGGHVRLIPGEELEIPDAVAEEVIGNPAVQQRLEDGRLSKGSGSSKPKKLAGGLLGAAAGAVSEANPLEELNAGEAIAKVKEIGDVAELRRLHDLEERVTVRAVIDSRIEALGG